MKNFRDIIITATLNNGKRIVIEPNYTSEEIHYRYMTDAEISKGIIDTLGTYIWQSTKLYSTVEGGQTVLFANIEATPVVINRF